MNDDPRTFGGVPARETAGLVRTPLNIPLQPVQRDEGHPSLGTAGEIARSPGRGIADDQQPPPIAPDFTTPESGLLGIVKDAQIPLTVLKKATDWFQKGTHKSGEELSAIDERDRARTEQELRAVWGNKYEKNLKRVGEFVNGLPEVEADVIHSARDPATGSALLNDAELLVRLGGLARRPQPAELSIAGIEAFWRTPGGRAAYNKDEALQARYRQLLNDKARAG